MRWFCNSVSSCWTFSALVWISLSRVRRCMAVGHGGAHGGDVKRLVDVIAGAQPQRLADGVRGFERRHHHRLDVGIHVFQAFEHFDAGHAGHADVQHRHVNFVFLRQFDRRRPVLGHQQIIIVLENDAQRLARPLLVIHNQQRALAPGPAADSAAASTLSASMAKAQPSRKAPCRQKIQDHR